VVCVHIVWTLDSLALVTVIRSMNFQSLSFRNPFPADANPYSQKDDSKGRWSLVMVPPEGPENNSDQREFLKEHLHYLLACTDTRYLPRLSDKAEEMGGSGSLGSKSFNSLFID
jgi:hypothetical protein